MRKAYELRGRTSEREKFYISSTYERFRHRKSGGGPHDLELWAQTYPA